MVSKSVGKHRPATLLGIHVDETRLQAVWVRRRNGTCHVQKAFDMPLEHGLRADQAEAQGRALRQHLEKAGVRQSRCVVSLPLGWTSTMTVPIPDLPESDVASFLDLEAERGFLFAQESLSIQASRVRTPGGERFATLVSVSRNHLDMLERVLQAARLRALSIVPGLAVQQSPDSETGGGIIALAPRDRAVDLQITAGGGLVVLRSLDVIDQHEEEPARIDVARLSRELRVTLGQLPDGLRAMVHRVKIIGADDLAESLSRELEGTCELLGLSCESVRTLGDTPLKGVIPENPPATPALMLAVQTLRGVTPHLEFLPPRVSPWRQVTEKIRSRRLAWGAAALAALVLGGGGLFLQQQWQLSSLQRQWDTMEPRVESLGEVQARIKQFRSWYDESYRSLRILRGLTEAFPETGVVTAKTIAIREPGEVTCTGEAGYREAVLEMLEQLSRASEVRQVKVDQILGRDPLQFSFNFQWETGGAGE